MNRILHRYIDEIEVKRCSRCGQWMPLTDFTKERRSWDGLGRECNACKKTRDTKYRAENADKLALYQRAWYAENSARKIASNAQYNMEHRDEIAAWHKSWYAENVDTIRAYIAQWSRENPDKTRASAARRRALKHGATVEPITDQDWDDLRAEYGGICPYCNERIEDGHFDHIAPLSRGGEHSVDNLVWVCARCNLEKSDKSLLTFLRGRVWTGYRMAGD